MTAPTPADLERFKALSYEQQRDLLPKLSAAARPYFELVAKSKPAHNWTENADKNSYNKARNAALTHDRQNIGQIPWHEIQWEHRIKARESLQYYLEYYHSKTFSLKWASYHYLLMEAFERSATLSEYLAFAAPRGGGKALALDTWLPTPHGWTTMGQVSVDDFLLDETGKPTKVVAKSALDMPEDCYAIYFGSGARIVADARHQWVTDACDITAVRTTQQLADTFGVGHKVTMPDGTKVPITGIERVQPELVQCVEVDAPNSLYLCSEYRIPTHNSKLTEASICWATLNNYRNFVLVVGATGSAGIQRLQNIKKQLQLNKRLRRDYPEVCYPIYKLGGNARKAEGQHVDGLKTAITWGNELIAFPTIQYPQGWEHGDLSGTVIGCAGLTGNLRGWSITTQDLEDRRPDMVVADDPQTRESSASPSQCATRRAIVEGDLAYLSGAGSKRTSVIIPCTVIARGDLADQLLDREQCPQFNGIRTKMLESMPENDEAVQAYIEHVKACQRNQEPYSVRNAYYLEHQDEIEAGAVASWPERFDEDQEEVSAIQHAIHLMARSMEAFYAEGQNEPYVDPIASMYRVPPDDIAGRMSKLDQYVCPEWGEYVLTYIDVQMDVLPFVSGCAASNFRGQVIDWGSYPGQNRNYWELSRLSTTLTDAYPRATTRDARIIAGVRDLIADLAMREYHVRGEDGTIKRTLKNHRILIDCAHFDDAVYEGIRESGHAGLVLPTRGIGITEDMAPMSSYTKRPGETHGHNWLIKSTAKADRMLQIDSNYWMTFAHETMRTAFGDPGSWHLWRDRDPRRHQLLGDAMNSEYCELKKSERWGRSKIVWQEPPNANNHLSDCYRGMLAGLSTLGCKLPEHISPMEEAPEVKTASGGRRGRLKLVKTNPTLSRESLNRMRTNGGQGYYMPNGSID